MEKKTVLVSGSTGQVGRELQNIADTNRDLGFHFRDRSELNLGSEDSIRNNLAEGFDYFINAGAYTAVDRAEEEFTEAFRINAEALRLMAIHAPLTTKIIHISTDYVYHSREDRPLRESDPTMPKSVYAESKLKGEHQLLEKRPDALVFRTSWVYSSYGHNFVKTMLRLGNERSELGIVSDQTGSPTYAADIAQLLVKVISHPEIKGVFNYSNTGQTNWADFARTIFGLTGIQCEVRDITTKEFGAAAPRPSWSVMSKQKLLNHLDIYIPHWEESLQKCLRELGYEL